MIVVDASLIGNLFIRSDHSPLAVQVFEKDPDWYAPFLWQSEVGSIITSYFRYRGLTLDKAYRIMDEAHAMMMEHERFISSTLVLELVVTNKCTSYDCEYVALAKEMNRTLVTFDKQVVEAFPQITVFPQEFIML